MMKARNIFRRGERFFALAVLLLAGCARPVYNPMPTPVKEELPPRGVMPFNEGPVESPTAGYSPTVYINPLYLTLEVGQTRTVQVWAEGVERVNTLSVEMSFDPALIQVEDADPTTEGIQVAPGDLLGLVLDNRVEEGRIFYSAAVEPGGTSRASGVAFSVPIRGLQAGTASLRLEHAGGQDVSGEPVQVSLLADGLVAVSGGAAHEELPPPVGELSPTPSPTPRSAVQPTPLSAVQPTPLSAVQPTPLSAGAGGIYYVVQPGENLFRIGLKFGTTAQAIASASNIPDPRRVSAGTMVLVPVPPPGGGYGYYVHPGNTAYSIARRFGMTVEELATLNGIGPDYKIRAGTILKVVPRFR